MAESFRRPTDNRAKAGQFRNLTRQLPAGSRWCGFFCVMAITAGDRRLHGMVEDRGRADIRHRKLTTSSCGLASGYLG